MAQIENITYEQIMTPPTDIYKLDISTINPYIYSGMKIILIVFLLGYLIAALLTLKQISLMTNTIKSYSNKYIFLIGYVHLFAVLITLIFAITVL
jgi:hypothetical protein